MRRVFIIAVAAGLVFVMGTSVSEGVAPTPSAGQNMIIIYESSYYPKRLQVAAGTPITVAHEEAGVPHSVTARDGSFDTGVFYGDIRDFTAPDTPGRYLYSCRVHGPRVMRGVIIVTG